MNKEEFIKKLDENIKKMNINLSNSELEKFYKYKELLIEWNSKINLTAIVDDIDIINKHFVDSIIINKYVNKEKVIDIGTGAGFPGIPLKIINDKLEVTLLDSLNKRVNFLNIVINELNLNNIEAIHGRAEEVFKNKKYREMYDIATSRAVAQLNVLVEYMLPAVKVGGTCICMKGNNIKEELDKSRKAIKVLGGKLEKVEEFVIPNTDYKRNIIIIKKEKSTPIKYPRKAGIPSKEPI